MTLQTSTLRPGLLVSLKTSVRGNVSYSKQTIESEHVTEDGAQRAVWETVRRIADPAEHEAAAKVRSKARSLISAVCANSAFGLLCPEANAAELESAMAEARKLVADFNANAALTRISLYIIAGRVAPDDVEAVRAINSEVRDLLADMQEGVQNLSVKAIREAADKARSIGQMLTPDAQARINVAIEAARKTARAIVKAGEQAAVEVDRRTLRTLEEARTAFLDIDQPTAAPAMPEAESRALDFTPAAEPANVPAAVPAALEIE